MCQHCTDFAAGLIPADEADVCSDAERGVFGVPAGEGDWEDVAPPDAEPAEAGDGEDDGEFDDFADLYYGE